MRTPTKWFWAEHRLPRQLKRIEEGKECYFPTFIRIFAERRIPNYNDLMQYFVKQYGFWVKCGYFEEMEFFPCGDFEVNLDKEVPKPTVCHKCGADLIVSNEHYI